MGNYGKFNKIDYELNYFHLFSLDFDLYSFITFISSFYLFSSFSFLLRAIILVLMTNVASVAMSSIPIESTLSIFGSVLSKIVTKFLRACFLGASVFGFGQFLLHCFGL